MRWLSPFYIVGIFSWNLAKNHLKKTFTNSGRVRSAGAKRRFLLLLSHLLTAFPRPGYYRAMTGSQLGELLRQCKFKCLVDAYGNLAKFSEGHQGQQLLEEYQAIYNKCNSKEKKELGLDLGFLVTLPPGISGERQRQFFNTPKGWLKCWKNTGASVSVYDTGGESAAIMCCYRFIFLIYCPCRRESGSLWQPNYPPEASEDR